MLVVEQNTTFVNWEMGKPVSPLQYAGDVVVAFDPSKTNMAMCLMTPTGDILNCIEFSGNNRGRGPAMDTTLYCEELRSFMSQYLKHAHLYVVGAEQTILPKGKRSNYYTNTVMNEIRANLINFFLEEFHMRIVEVNNWSWKHAILPDGYRSREEKGSKRWFLDNFSDTPYAYYFNADMTDCICVGWYLCKTKCQGYSLYCNRVEQSLSGFTYSYVPSDSEVCRNLKEVSYNSRFSVDDNLAYYSNRILSTFCMQVEADRLSIDQIYGHSMLFEQKNLHDRYVKVVAKRK